MRIWDGLDVANLQVWTQLDAPLPSALLSNGSFPTFPFCNSCTVSSLHTPFQYRVTPTTESIISYIEIYLSKQAFVKSVDEIVGKMFYTFNEYILNWDAVSETWLTKHSIHGCFDVIMKAVHHGRCRFRGADMFFTGFCEKEAMVIKKVERKGPFRFYAETPTLDLLSPWCWAFFCKLSSCTLIDS